MSDIVERLREAEDDYKALRDEEAWALTHDAADTIEALQARVRELEAECAEVESRVNIIMRLRTDFAGDPPYVGAQGAVTALSDALDQRDEWRLKFDAADFGRRHGEDLNGMAISAVRDLLNANDVPQAGFIDDHVGNAIVQRNEARDRNRALEEALRPFGDTADLIDTEMQGVTDEDEVHLLLHDYLLDRFTVYLFRRARDVLKGEE